MRPVYLAMTAAGAETAKRAALAIPGDVMCRRGLGLPGASFESIVTAAAAAFADGRPVVGFCAAGILIRSVAELLADKAENPPVLAISEDGTSVVPLVGGHHGANRLAADIAGALGGYAAITTAGDLRYGVALDDPPPGWVLANPGDAKPVMAALLAGASARIDGEARWLAASALPVDTMGAVCLTATVKSMAGAAEHLVYHPKKLALGVGCERGADAAEITALVEATLAETGFAREAIACVISLDLKADEVAILALANSLDVPARFFTANHLEAEAPRLANPSDIVFSEVGCHGVAEGAALAAAGPDSTLIVAKRKSARATCALAQSGTVIDPGSVGRSRGRLAIIGLGPGQESWRTPEARNLIERSDTIIGYSYYLDQITDLTAGRNTLGFPLGAEEERVRKALTLAGEGRDVALVSSGDAGIYAMASLVFECLEDEATGDGAKRAEIVVAPGISALQAAAARIGAPLGHDFCTISLSDLLTPWPVIEKRITAAAQGDFVIAFYNPVSQRRRSQLATARDILLAHRPADTPVILGRLLGREGESVKVVDLADLAPDDVDMMTLVMVGSSQSRRMTLGARQFVFTPRGYANKRGRQ